MPFNAVRKFFTHSPLKSVALTSTLLLGASALFTPAEAAPVVACAKYQRHNDMWSHGCKVKGEVISGAEMNVHAKKRTYDAGAYCYVVSWKKGGWSVIRLHGAEVPAVETSLMDQSGRTWIVRRGSIGCY